MCDEFTAGAEEAHLARRGLNRRQFAALGAAGMALVGCSGTVKADGGSDVSEKMVSITTADGICDAFFVHPAKGTHPGVILWPDIAGLRDAFKIMARNLAAEGYAVLAVNQYYRGSPAPVLDSFSEWRTPEGQAKIAPLREALTPDAVTSDAKAFVAFLDQQEEVDIARGIGSNGYCMGGPFTVRSAAAVPSRVKAAASFHGAGMVTDAPDSPHRLLARTQAGFLFAIARNDDERQPEQKTELRKAADAAGRPAEIEVYPADHGWCVVDSPAYDPNAADKAWQRMLALFSGL
ncbi:dienelactone hydrolase family protein [Novosphingobium mangrovi (ex Huang et al. 2023)]|uniref:Dienelactone hydrolase family protein n=1 Tax=Novosphingobium mangrovi (ex Huang et al. 2023) TaxID=2976432 RepID=A0ABT2I8F6_9SPHN|nr:dienelactone hydrolase family protein [Novosphingobium mangrovi (ex Huang et al. 2023)]MCT2401115.1 dienelactone hydrolase family protein [Novosphingobium mangrovi (ex Huang et al. 2023)]